MDYGPGQFGKWLIVLGLVIISLGVIMMVFGKIGLFKLPGDLEFGGKNWRFYLPLASSILLSIILTVILWLVNYFRNK
jgi:hypothetical protein